MTSLLRRALARNGTSFISTNYSRQQYRGEGNLPVITNKYVEEWNTRREHLEDEFRFTPKTLLVLAVTCVAVPIALFKLTILQFDMADDACGRERRRFWPRDKLRDD